MNTNTNLKAAITIIQAVSSAIKEAGAIPSGHLYSILMQFGCNIQQYDLLINTLKKTGKVQEHNNLLYWID